MYVVCKNILGAHGVSSSENGCFDSSPCNKNNFLQNKRVKVVFGWMVQTKLTLVNGRNNVESGTHIYSTFYYIVVQFQVLWILSLKHVSPMHSSAAQPKKNLLISKPGKRSLSPKHTFSLSLPSPYIQTFIVLTCENCHEQI